MFETKKGFSIDVSKRIAKLIFEYNKLNVGILYWKIRENCCIVKKIMREEILWMKENLIKLFERKSRIASINDSSLSLGTLSSWFSLLMMINSQTRTY